jgi:hypothetical protein
VPLLAGESDSPACEVRVLGDQVFSQLRCRCRLQSRSGMSPVLRRQWLMMVARMASPANQTANKLRVSCDTTVAACDISREEDQETCSQNRGDTAFSLTPSMAERRMDAGVSPATCSQACGQHLLTSLARISRRTVMPSPLAFVAVRSCWPCCRKSLWRGRKDRGLANTSSCLAQDRSGMWSLFGKVSRLASSG